MVQKQPLADPAAPASLDVDQDLEFQRAEWTAQRIGWVVMAALILLALAGLTGAGPLATAEASGPGDALRVEYSRFERVQAAAELRVELAVGGADQVQLWIASDYLDAIELDFISPDPVESRAADEGQLLSFAAADGAAVVPVTLQFRPKRAGIVDGTLRHPNGDEVAFRQVVYP